MTAHHPTWLQRLSHPKGAVEHDDLARELVVQRRLRELREEREPLDLDVAAEATLHALLGRAADR
jgi:hypothetical protein